VATEETTAGAPRPPADSAGCSAGPAAAAPRRARRARGRFVEAGITTADGAPATGTVTGAVVIA
jgi:hypothetical protein